MDQPWHIELFGWLRVVQADRVIARFRTRKAEALLAYLAYFHHRSHPRQQLIELLWPECDPSTGLRRLSVELTSLRHQLEPPGVPPGAVLVATRTEVQLNPAACTTDVALFEAALQAASQTASPAERAEQLTVAAQLYRGQLLPGCFDDWILAERQRLAEAFLQALHRLVGLLEELGDVSGALQWARRAVAADSLDEESHHRLIRLLLSTGQVEAARDQYERGQEMLLRELGEGLSPEIHALITDLAPRKDRPPSATPGARGRHLPSPGPELLPTGSAASPGIDASTGAALPRHSSGVATRPTDNLPLRFTRFFGREREIQQLCELQGGARLITLTGPGGTGKTRLALQVAQQLRDVFPGGAWFVSLRDLADPALIPDQILLSLRLTRAPEREALEQVATFLLGPSPSGGGGRGPSLLLLDNFEHLVEGGVEIVHQLLEQVEQLTLFATSRQRLGLEGEREFPVAPLPVPDAAAPGALLQCPSVQLFVDRAQAVRPDFQVTFRNAAAMAGLCQRLEGLPLAIELAAARAAVLTPQQMLTRLEQRFELLVGRQRAADPRHRSLRATLDWSYQLLSLELQRFFVRLSIFRGGFTLGAAEAVCEEPRALECLEELQQCSLVESQVVDDEMRYRLLETLREYGAEQLTAEERTALAWRHLTYYLAWAAETGPEIGVKFQVLPQWLDQAEREHDNLRAALDWMVRSAAVQDWLLGTEKEKHPPFIALLVNFWQQRGHQAEGRQWLAKILAMPGAAVPTVPRAYLLHEAGALARQQGDFAAADAFVQESLVICRELGVREGELWCCGLLALVAREQGDYARARAFYERTTAIARELGEGCDIACAFCGMGYMAFLEGDLVTAQSLLERSLQMLRSLRDEARKGINCDARGGIAWVYAHLGEVADAHGDYPAAQAHLDESMAIVREFRSLGDPAYVLHKLGRVAQHQGQWNAAANRFSESLAVWRQIGNKQGITECIEGLGAVAAGQGELERSARLFGAAAALRKSRNILPPPVERADLNHGIAVARAGLGETAFAAAWSQGQATPLKQIIAQALKEVPAG